MPATVADVMCWSSLMIRPNCLAEKALQIMVEAEAEDLAVVDPDDQFLGIISDYELLKADLTNTLEGEMVSQFMQRQPQRLAPEQPLIDACKLFREARISRVPVVRDGRLLGVIRRQDVMRAIWYQRCDATEDTSTIQPPKFLSPALASSSLMSLSTENS